MFVKGWSEMIFGAVAAVDVFPPQRRAQCAPAAINSPESSEVEATGWRSARDDVLLMGVSA